MQDSEIVEQPEPDRRAARSTRNNVCLRRARYGRARQLGQRCDAKHAKPMLLASTEQLVALLTRVLGSDVLLDDVICRARAHSQIEALKLRQRATIDFQVKSARLLSPN